ncbi:ATPase YjoB [Phlyctema vagabunda]|uniref:ATPase YjoB n=1 Tax=Phlyctema vagabunda TaxID=108571 RepID=A0ABR4PX95_9HELO
MASFEDFVCVNSSPGSGSSDSVGAEFIKHSSGKRIYTPAIIARTLRSKYPKHHITVSRGNVNLISYASSQPDVKYQLREPSEALIQRQFIPPARRYNDETGGSIGESIQIAGYDFDHKGDALIVYIVQGRDGLYVEPSNFILVAPSGDEVMTQDEKAAAQKKADVLLESSTRWSQELHGEVLIFDNGYWQKNKELWENVQKSYWFDVIMEEKRKEAIIEDVIGFFDAEKRYAEFKVPWKRGVIFYGPPGNGKTISTKALMHDLSQRTSPDVESLYVKTFKTYAGPEAGIRMIFQKARQMAPCLLIFEDIDSLVDVSVRSYFLNEVDGLESNHGILMIGSTNHLERLDPGIAKRPSRFDRKYLFDVPNRGERIQYCEYWRYKLRKNKKVDFPGELSSMIADLTSDFSFAYMKEAFVAALLVIVAKKDEQLLRSRRVEDDFRDNVFWKEIKKQIAGLRKEMEEESLVDEEEAPKPAEAAVREPFSWPNLSSLLDERSILGPERGESPQYAMPRYM